MTPPPKGGVLQNIKNESPLAEGIRFLYDLVVVLDTESIIEDDLLFFGVHFGEACCGGCHCGTADVLTDGDAIKVEYQVS